MPKPPKYSQKRYRGRIRNDMTSAVNHIQKLVNWNTRYHAGALTSYPNQLATDAEMQILINGRNQLQVWLADKGPIPSR